MFDLQKYHQNISTQWLGQTVEYFEELDSTNSYLKKLAQNKITHGQLCLTDHQIKGRGQYERNWESGKGQNLTFTLVFQPKAKERFHILTLACARALIDVIEAEADCQGCIKWPNDVLINGQKVAGLLTETVFNGNKLGRLLVGIGINVNQEQFSDEIKERAGSLKAAGGQHIDRERFLCDLLSRIEFEYTRWHKQYDEQLKWINRRINGYGQWVNLRVNNDILSGKFKLLGVDQDGKLAVINGDGEIKHFSYEQIRVIAD